MRHDLALDLCHDEQDEEYKRKTGKSLVPCLEESGVKGPRSGRKVKQFFPSTNDRKLHNLSERNRVASPSGDRDYLSLLSLAQFNKPNR